MIQAALVRLWRLMRGRLQWYALWLLHKKFIIGVSGVLFDDRGRVLLLRHRFWPEGSWGLPSGYATRNERFEETIAREVQEETGYIVVAHRQIRLVSGFRLRMEITFSGKFVGGVKKLDMREVMEAEFFDPANLPEGLLATHRDVISLAIKQQREQHDDACTP